jgi:uncharacterized protein DUF4244
MPRRHAEVHAQAPGGQNDQTDPTGLSVRSQPWRRVRLARVLDEAGMTTAEYAVGTVAACGFAGVLYKLLTSGTVVGLLTGIVTRALSTVG